MTLYHDIGISINKTIQVAFRNAPEKAIVNDIESAVEVVDDTIEDAIGNAIEDAIEDATEDAVIIIFIIQFLYSAFEVKTIKAPTM